jgi:hypothetical protein
MLKNCALFFSLTYSFNFSAYLLLDRNRGERVRTAKAADIPGVKPETLRRWRREAGYSVIRQVEAQFSDGPEDNIGTCFG